LGRYRFADLNARQMRDAAHRPEIDGHGQLLGKPKDGARPLYIVDFCLANDIRRLTERRPAGPRAGVEIACGAARFSVR
jgi:hypothetical protein